MADHDTHDHTGVPGVGGEQPVDTTDSPEFAAVNVGHPTDTTITRVSAGNLAVEGNALYRAGGTDVPVADGGTGASTASAAATNLGLGTGDSPEFTAVNLGHASDTTLTRVSAGVVAIEGTNIVKAGAVTTSGLTQATARLLGRTTASSGAIEEITVGAGLSLAAGSLTATGGGSTVDIEDEGSPEGSADTIDFVGAGVSVGFAGGTATVTIPGGGGSGPSGALPVAAASNTQTSTSSTLSVTITAAADGNLLIATISGIGGADVSSISCTNVTWTVVHSSTAATSPKAEIWKGVVSGGASGTTVTITFSANNSDRSAIVSEWAGITGTVDQTAQRANQSNSQNWMISPPIVPTDANALVVCVFATTNGSTQFTMYGDLIAFEPMLVNAGSLRGYQAAGYGFPGTVPVAQTVLASGNWSVCIASLT